MGWLLGHEELLIDDSASAQLLVVFQHWHPLLMQLLLVLRELDVPHLAQVCGCTFRLCSEHLSQLLHAPVVFQLRSFLLLCLGALRSDEVALAHNRELFHALRTSRGESLRLSGLLGFGFVRAEYLLLL